MAAAVVACFVAFMADVNDSESKNIFVIQEIYKFFSSDIIRQRFFLIMGPLLAFLMVSNVAYRSHKSIKIKGVKPFRLLALLVTAFGLIAYKPSLLGFLFFFIYALSGLFEWIVGWKKPTDDDDIFEPQDEDSIMESRSRRSDD